MLDFINQIFWINFFMFIWFNTDAFVEWCPGKFLKKILKISDFLIFKKENPKSDYLNYLRVYHNSFIVRLLTCKPCFLFWITLFSVFVFNLVLFFPQLYLISYILYKLLNKYVY